MSSYRRYNGYHSSSGGWGEMAFMIVARAIAYLVIWLIFSFFYSLFAPHVAQRYSPQVESDVYDCFYHATSHPDVTSGLNCLRDKSYAFQYPEEHGDGQLMLFTPYAQAASDIIYGCFDSQMSKYHLYTNEALKCLHDLGYILTQHHEVLPFKDYDPTPTPVGQGFERRPR